MTLPVGEEPLGWMGAIDYQGRTPYGSILVRAVHGRFGGTFHGWKLWWAPSIDRPADLPSAGEMIPAGVMERYEAVAVVSLKSEPTKYTVMAPRSAGGAP